MNMVTVRLHGPLADVYGHEHQFAISTPREAIHALNANYPGFRRDFIAVERYALFVDGDWREDQEGVDVAGLPCSREIDFCPVIEGRITGLITAGLGLIGITGVTATILSSVIAIGLLVGVSMLLAPKPKEKTSEDSKKDESYMFSGPENVTEQGVAVPLVYGRCFCGSVVVSAGLEVGDVPITAASTTLVQEGVSEESFSLFAAEENPSLLAARAASEPPPPPDEFITPPGRSSPRYVPENA